MSKLISPSHLLFSSIKTGVRILLRTLAADRFTPMIVSVPDDEPDRLQALGRYEHLDPGVEVALQELTDLSARILQMPMAAIALGTPSHCVLKSHIGATADELDLAVALSAYPLKHVGLVVLNPLTQAGEWLKGHGSSRPGTLSFYAGAPLISPEGYPIGVLGIMDRVPQHLSETQQDTLKTLASQAIAILERHRIQPPPPDQPPLLDLLNQTHDAIQTLRLSDQSLQYVNPVWLTTFGYTREEVRGMFWWDILDPTSFETASTVLEKLRLRESLSGINLILLTKTGDRVWVEANFSSLWERNQPDYAIALFRNVTGEQQARLKYEQLFENTALGLFQLTLEGRYSQINSALAKMYGYESPTQFLSRVERISQLYLQPNEWSECLHLLETHGHLVHEVEVKRADDSTIWISENIRLILDIKGRAVGYEGFVQDVTRNKQAEATVQLARDQLQAVLDAVPGTVSLISADFHYLGVNRHLAATYNLPLAQFIGREVGFRQSAFGQFVRDFFATQSREASIEIDSEVNGAFRSDLVIAKKWLEDQAAVFVGIDITERKRAEAALKAELAEAAEYVRSLLPLPLSEPVPIDSRFIPSQQLGGDCFDYYWLDDEHLAIYLLDVSGHGSRAALLSVSVLNLLRARFLPDTNFYQPCQVLTALNQAIKMERQRNMYFTIWYGVYNPVQRQLVYSCAGHPPAILLSKDAPVQKLRTETSVPIGMFPNIKYENAVCQIEANSSLYIFSDGIYEINEPDGSMWSLENFIELLGQCGCSDSFNLEEVLGLVRQVSKEDTFHDDVSLLQVKFDV
jgi:phosphoserine phosphatase RsbU/P